MNYEQKKITVGVVKLENGKGTWGATLKNAMPIEMDDVTITGYKLIFGHLTDEKVEASLNSNEDMLKKAISDIGEQIDHVSNPKIEQEIEQGHAKFGDTERFVEPFFRAILFFKQTSYGDGTEQAVATFAHGITIGNKHSYLEVLGMDGIPNGQENFSVLCSVFIRRQDGKAFAVASADIQVLSSIMSSLKEQLGTLKESQLKNDGLNDLSEEAKKIAKQALKQAEANSF